MTTPSGASPDNGKPAQPPPSASGAWDALLAATLAVVAQLHAALPPDSGPVLDAADRLFQGLAEAAKRLEEQLTLALADNVARNVEVGLLRRQLIELTIAARESEARWHEAEMRERSAVEKLRQAHRVTDTPTA